MSSSYTQLLALVAPVYGVIVVGLLIRRLRWLTAEADASLLRVSVNLLTPCLILDSIVGNAALRETRNLLLPPLIGFGTVVAGFALARALARPCGLREPARARTFAFSVGLYNYGFIALPLVIGLFDDLTLGVLFTHNLGVEIALWTAGVMMLTGASGGTAWRRALNGPVLAVLIGLPLNFAHAREWMPETIFTAIHMLAVTAVPMALILTGAALADWLPRARLSRSEAAVPIAACLLRLGLLPLLFLLIARFLPMSVELQRVMIIQAAMPAAVIPIVLARHYAGDTSVAIQVVISTCALGLLTIPWWIRFGLHFLNL